MSQKTFTTKLLEIYQLNTVLVKLLNTFIDAVGMNIQIKLKVML